MYDMNCIMHRLISSVQVYAPPTLVTMGGATGARARVSGVEVQDVIEAQTIRVKGERHVCHTSRLK